MKRILKHTEFLFFYKSPSSLSVYSKTSTKCRFIQFVKMFVFKKPWKQQSSSLDHQKILLVLSLTAWYEVIYSGERCGIWHVIKQQIKNRPLIWASQRSEMLPTALEAFRAAETTRQTTIKRKAAIFSHRFSFVYAKSTINYPNVSLMNNFIFLLQLLK